MANAKALMGLALLVVLPLAFTAESVDVCPANSLYKTLPFLKLAKPGNTLSSLIVGHSVDTTAITGFVKTTLVPLIGANVFFFVLAALLFLIFILWRLFRFCCCLVCCKSSCDEKRMKNNPHKLLFSKGAKALKAFMFIFGLVSVAFAVYGMIKTDKNVTDGAFGVVKSLSLYATNVTDTVDNLVGSVRGVSDVIDQFQAIVINDMDVDGFNTHLTAVGTFLTAIKSPRTLKTDITALNTKFATDLDGHLDALSTGISNFNGDMNNFNISLNALKDLGTATANPITDIASLCKAISDAMTTIAWNNPVPPATSDITALKTAIESALADITNWDGRLSPLTNHVTYVTAAANNPFTKLNNLVTPVISDVAGGADIITALDGDVNTLNTKYTTTKADINWLLAKLVEVNNTVIELTPSMQSAHDNLADTKTQLDTLLDPTSTSGPSALVSTLDSFSSGMPNTASLTAISSDLAPAGITVSTVFSAANGVLYKNWISATSGDIVPLQTQLSNFRTQIISYESNSSLWDNLRNTDYPAFTPAFTPFYTPSTTGYFTATELGKHVALFGAAAATMVAAAPIDTSTANTYVNNAQAQLGNLPNLTTYTASLDAVIPSWDALGASPADVVNSPKAHLADIKSKAITTGNSVKDQITATLSGVGSNIDNIKNIVSGKLDSVINNYQDDAKKYDGYRYLGAMVLYGVSILFVALLLLASLANYHFGANFSTFWLLVVTILYFLLAVIIALLISVLYLSCGEIESLVVNMAPASFAPLLRYYFYNEGVSVSGVLKDAGLVDLDSVMTQMTTSQNSVVQDLTGTFTFRSGPMNIINSLNTTIDGITGGVEALLQRASRDELMPVYGEVKGFVCCAVPDMFTSMWTGLTFSGVFATALIFLTFFFIGRIDKVPRKDCCGCTCHTAGKYVGTVVPGTLPQYNTNGFEAHSYNAPNGAMWGEGGATAQVVIGAPPKGKGF